MMKQYLISSVFSLSLISLAQAAEPELSVAEQCLAMGYDTQVADCEAAGSAALICPVNNGSSDMAICITDSCRGYPLFKKNGRFYYLDQAGNEIEAVPSKGKIEDYMDGGFETCTAGYGNNAVTYYRVPKCKGKALYNNYFCDVGCDTEKKYPYTYHPGNTAGIVQKCVTADQTYYGYSSCNKGWLGGWSSAGGIGRCGLDDCNMVDYPYPVEPNAYHYGENRGKTETCKIGGAVYYRYTECNGSDFVLKGVNVSDKKGTVCARKCPVTDCHNTPFTHTYPNGDTAEINDWHCEIKNTKCTAGDIATLNNKEIGTILSITDDRILLVPIDYQITNQEWCANGLQEINVPHLKDGDKTTSGKIQTRGFLLYQDQSGYSYPAAEYCFKYIGRCLDDVCMQGEWYLPSLNEIAKDANFINSKYLIANVLGDRSFVDADFNTATEATGSATIAFKLSLNLEHQVSKCSNRPVLPMLKF